MSPDPVPVVYKFGGTSVADAGRIRHVAGLVAAEPAPVVVVVSALGGVTDLLAGALRAAAARDAEAVATTLDALRSRHLEVLGDLAPPGPDREDVGTAVEAILDGLAARLGAPALLSLPSDAPPASPGASSGGDAPAGVAAAPAGDAPLPVPVDDPRDPTDGGAPAAHADAVLATGEDLSARLVALALRAAGCPARPVDARGVVRTDGRHGGARPDDGAVRERAARRLRPLLDAGIVPVLQGFVGATGEGDDERTTTLGRGGSDLTASVLGAALDAAEVHVWTDVDGILSGDPRAVDAPRILGRVGFEEAVELAYFGAKVLHPEAAKHAVSRGVPLWIRNTFRPDGGGTRVLAERWGAATIAAVAYKPRVLLVKVRSHPAALPYGFLARVFEILARHRLPVDLVATSHSSTAFTLDRDEAGPQGAMDEVVEELSAFADVELVPDLATVTVVGHGLLEVPGIDALVFETVGTTPIHLISQASDVSLSLLVDESRAPELVRRLHAAVVGRSAPADPGGPGGATPAAPPGHPTPDPGDAS